MLAVVSVMLAPTVVVGVGSIALSVTRVLLESTLVFNAQGQQIVSAHGVLPHVGMELMSYRRVHQRQTVSAHNVPLVWLEIMRPSRAQPRGTESVQRAQKLVQLPRERTRARPAPRQQTVSVHLWVLLLSSFCLCLLLSL